MLSGDKGQNKIDFTKITACGGCCVGGKKKGSGICKGCIEADGIMKNGNSPKAVPYINVYESMMYNKERHKQADHMALGMCFAVMGVSVVMSILSMFGQIAWGGLCVGIGPSVGMLIGMAIPK